MILTCISDMVSLQQYKMFSPILSFVGMNDVLPKPFTKEGMLRFLEKHLPAFKKSAPPSATQQFQNPPQMPHPGGFVTPSQTHAPLGLNIGQMSANQALKDESPGKSPATASSWHSPNQLPGASPVGTGPGPGTYMQPMSNSGPYNLTPTHAPPPNFPPGAVLGAPRGGPSHRRVMSEMGGPSGPSDEHPEKRQRMYPPGSFPQ